MRRIPWSYIFASAVAVLFSWVLHELAHWYAGEFLDNEMTMSMNSTRPVSGTYGGQWHYMLISAAGPAFTILEAFVFYKLILNDGDEHLFPVLLTCLYMRTLAAVMSFHHPNDEARISTELGIGKFTLPLLVIGLLAWWTRKVIREKKYSTRLVLGTLFLVILFSSILILGDQRLRLTII